MQMQNSRLLLAALLLRCTDGLMLAPPTRKVGTLTLSEADSTSTNFRGDDSTGTRIWDAGLVLSRILSEEPSIEGARVSSDLALASVVSPLLPAVRASYSLMALLQRCHCSRQTSM
jgi:hypothetical protein